MTNIAVIITAHGPRIKNGLLLEAVLSVFNQTRVPDQLIISFDNECILGAAANKQRALESVTCEFTAVLDSDDIMLPEHLRVLEDGQLESGADLVYSWFETDPPGGDPFPDFFFTDPWDPEHPRHTTTTILGRTEMMKKVGYRQTDVEGWPHAEDDWLMTSGLIDLGAKVHHVAKRTWIYRHHNLNTSGFAGKGDAA